MSNYMTWSYLSQLDLVVLKRNQEIYTRVYIDYRTVPVLCPPGEKYRRGRVRVTTTRYHS